MFRIPRWGAKASEASALRQILAVCQPLRAPLAIAVPLIAVNRMAGLVMPLAMKFLVDDVLVQRRASPWVFFAATAGAAVVQGVTSLGLMRVLSRAYERLAASLRARLHEHLVTLPLLFHESRKVGSLVSSIMTDTTGFSRLFSTGIVDAGSAMLSALIAFVLLLQIEPYMACGALGLVLVHTVLSQRVGCRVTSMYRDHHAVRADLVGRLTESLSGIRLVKAHDAERHEIETFRIGVWRLFDKWMSATLTSEALRAGSIVITGVGSATLLALGGWKVLSGDLTLGGLMAFGVALSLLVSPISQIADLAARLPDALAGVQRTLALLAEAPEARAAARTVRIAPIRGAVTFERVSFSYVPGRPVLHEISFDIEPGTVTAFIGASGAGKSTIAALVASLYAPEQGRILVDGIDLAKVSFDSYRPQLGMVLQDTFLFDGSILDNVMFSRAGTPEAQVVAACRAARVDEFAERLPDGYHTLIGERGVKLSGGQRQRLAIARAILANPRILILDEPTSSLDAASEEALVQVLQGVIAGRTSFVISHRPALLETADRVFVVEAGRISERRRVRCRPSVVTHRP
jgi:ABC-type bacteriocin/lantibiotic exporter with double-glycine peptidase domain